MYVAHSKKEARPKKNGVGLKSIIYKVCFLHFSLLNPLIKVREPKKKTIVRQGNHI